MATETNHSIRILSIDIMRGLTLFLMLFVNDLYEPGVPFWLVHAKATEDRMGLADWVFPGFLFMVGLAIPFAFLSRRRKGDSDRRLLRHIVVRTLSLLLIGVFMVNIGRLNPDLTGMPRYSWAILAYLSFFLIWNHYPVDSPKKNWFLILKMLGVAGLALLASIYKAGTPQQPEWMHTSWWGILGLIGWGYLVAALAYLFTKGKLFATIGIWLAFIVLNMLSSSGRLGFLDPIKPIFGVIIDGNTPSIVLCGLVVGILLSRYQRNFRLLLYILIPLGLVVLLSGFMLRNWFILSKIQGTPSWAMVCNGISILLFTLLFYLIDQRKVLSAFAIFKPAGQNSLTTYLAPDILYYTIWSLGWPILVYKQDQLPWLAVSGSLLWAFAMIGFASLLWKLKIRLKL